MSDSTNERLRTRAPQTIGQKPTLAAAHRMTNDHGIRHLPVLEGGKLVGLLAQRVLDLIETLKHVDPDEVKASEALSPSPSAHWHRFGRWPLKWRSISTVPPWSWSRGKVLGVFTTVDALRALFALLKDERKGGELTP